MERTRNVVVADVLSRHRVACGIREIEGGALRSRPGKRILVAAGALCPGSVAKVVFDIVAGLSDYYFHIWVEPGKERFSLHAARRCLADFGPETPSNFEIVSSRDRIRMLAPEIRATFLNLFTSDSWFMPFSLERGIPIVTFSHSVCYFEEFPFSSNPLAPKVAWQRRAYILADKIVCWSNIERQLISRFLPIVSEKIKVVPLCQKLPKVVPVGRTRPSKGDLRVLFAGRPLAKRKGFEYLVNALRELAAKGCDVELTVADAFTNAARLAQFRFSEALRGIEVRWLSDLERKEMRRAYRHAHVVVAPSLYDSWCKVVTEAIAEATPVITTDAAGVTEYFPCDEIPRVKAGDSKEIAIAIEHLLSDYESHLNASEKARERLKAEFTLEKQSSRLRKALGLE